MLGTIVHAGHIQNVIVKRISSSPLFTWPVAAFTKQNVDSSIYKCRFTLLYAEAGKLDRKGVPILSSWSLSDATEKSKSARKRESSKLRERKKENC